MPSEIWMLKERWTGSDHFPTVYCFWIRYWITFIMFLTRKRTEKKSKRRRWCRSGTSPKYWRNIGKYKFMQPLLFISCTRCFKLRSSGQFYRIDCILLRYSFVDSPIVRSRWRIGRYNDLHLLVNKSAPYICH